jgi:hypothetical protein
MTRILPGIEDGDGREFLYIEEPKGRDFSTLMDDVFDSCPTAPMPQSGGALEEKARITLPGKTSFLAISYQGDLLGWRNKILGYCGEKGLKWAAVREQFLTLSDGAEIPLADCQVEFEA